MKAFVGKTAVITGAASGIGKALAGRCAREGMNVVLADIEDPALISTQAELEAMGAHVLAVHTDVSNAKDIEVLAEKTIEAFDAVHLLVNNAGVTCAAASTWEYTVSDWKWVIGVNLWGVIHGIRVFTPLMLKQNTECHIVNTYSFLGLVSWAYDGGYNVTKHGVVTLSETLYKELVELGAKIKVSVLCPSAVKTRIMESDRNRPIELQDTSETTNEKALQYFESVTQAINARGMAPQTFADHVFEAIKNERFYVFPQKHLYPEIETRMNDILKERNPTL